MSHRLPTTRRVWPWVGVLLLAATCWLHAAHACEDKSAPASLRDPIDALLTKEFPADGPGAAVLVVYQGKVLVEKGYGLADLDKKTPITATTNFDLASASKQFTALAVMLLADRGRLDFDDDVRKYLPELPAYNEQRPIRVRDLLHHTSGLPDYTGFWRTKEKDFTKFTNESVLELMKDRKLAFTPGAKHAYSNTNYALLPVIVKRVTKKGFGEFMADEVFGPLGMETTVILDDMKVTIPERAKGYRKARGEWQHAALDGPTCGDGNVFSNLRDLGRWLAAVDAGKLAKAETWRRAFAPATLDDGKEAAYGFGWVIGKRAGKPFLGHGGGWAGTRTFIGRWPDDRLAVVVLSNSEQAQPGRVRVRIADLVLQGSDKPADKPADKPTIK
jgi:CubicO group peptidase (beta-lactamase class C family)